MELTTFFISITKPIYAKTLTVFESTFKIKVMLPWIPSFGFVNSCLQTKTFAPK